MEHAIDYNERYILEILPKISQWESIPYARDFRCQECGKHHRFESMIETDLKAKIVGWCNSDYGYMLVFECPHCFSKFRFHTTHDNKFNIDDFVDKIMYYYVGNENFENGLELEREWKEYELSKRI